MANPNLHFASLSTTAKSTLKQLKLSEAATFLRGSSLSKDDVREVADVSNGVPCVLYGHLYTTYGEIAYSSKYVTDAEIDEKVTSKAGDVLMPTSDVTPRGLATATCVMFDNAIVGGDINILRPQPGIDGRYLSLAINSQKQKLYPLIVGSTIRHLHASDLKGLSFFFPSIEEQQKIAEFFTALDEKIRIQLNTVDKLNAIKTGMLAKVFSYENTLAWTVRKFDEIFALTRTFPVSRDQISDECDKTSDNSKIIHYGDILTIYGNIVNPKSDSIGYLVTDVNAKDDDYLCDGDIVFADAAEDYTVGKAIELDGVDCKLLSGLHTIAARPKTSFASGYLSYFFNSPLFKSQVRTLATGTKVMSLTKSSIQTTSISFPSIEEQKKISNLLNTLDNKIAICNKKLEALKQLKKAFLQRMFV